MSIRILTLATAAATTLEGSIVRRQVRLVEVRKATHQTRRGFPMRLIAMVSNQKVMPEVVRLVPCPIGMPGLGPRGKKANFHQSVTHRRLRLRAAELRLKGIVGPPP